VLKGTLFTYLFLVYKVGFIREKGKITAREAQQSLQAGSSGTYFNFKYSEIIHIIFQLYELVEVNL
jgi:hypothetical protein